jgi:cell division septum initiation protein DivIVA
VSIIDQIAFDQIADERDKAQQENKLLKQRIKRLEEALAWYESTVSDCNRHGPEGDVARDALARDQGHKAKEAKP